MNKTLFIQLFVIVSIVGAYFLIDFNTLYKSFEKEVTYTVQDNSCDLHESACSINLDDKEFNLEVFPKDIPLMKNLKFVIKTNDKTFDEKTINIYATNMFMGYFNLKFNKVSDGIYEALGTLPTCPVGNMKWNADIALEDSKGARFQFETTR
jgi:hypothetical protein